MKKINLAITGCLGRMGQQLIKSSKSNKSFKLTALTENKPVNKKIAAIKIKKKSRYWNNWFYSKRREFNQKIFKKNPNFKGR